MNYKKVHTLIDFYIQNEKKIHFNQLEGYKWEILTSVRDEIIDYVKRHYKNNQWDQNFSDFREFTRKTIGKTGNLVYSSSRSVIQRAADKYPALVRKMFIDLSGFNSETSLEDRVLSFISSIDNLVKENAEFSKNGKSFHQDFRAVSVYLLMMNPELYYNYMYSTFYEFAKFVELKIPNAGDVHLLLLYYEVCNEIKQILLTDYKEWFELYLQSQKDRDKANEGRTDIYGNLVVQDIVFSLYYYNHPEEIKALEKQIVLPKKLRLKPARSSANIGQGAIVDYKAQQIKNEEIGIAAENFVLENERRMVAEYGFNPDERVRHISEEQGDGLGYDILSCDKEGRDLFIEVKGTNGGKKTALYITANELECSIMNAEKYRLYRVYDFSSAGTSGAGKIGVIEGSLLPYCINPVLYKVVF